MSYVRQDINGISPQDIMKMNQNFMDIFSKVFGDINFSDVDTAMKKKINTQWLPVQGEGNLDSTYPLYIRFFVPPNTEAIKTTSFNFMAEQYRMDSSVTSGGGGVAGGSVLLSIASGGGQTNTVSADASTSYVYKWGGVGVDAPNVPMYYITDWSDLICEDGITGRVYGYVSDPSGALGAPITVRNGASLVPSAPNKFMALDMYLLQHTHKIPEHSHIVSFDAHTHSGSANISIPEHSHNLNEGVKVSTVEPKGLKIFVNDILVNDMNNNKVLNSVDIKDKIRIGEWNTIKATTTSLARMVCYGTIEIIIKN